MMVYARKITFLPSAPTRSTRGVANTFSLLRRVGVLGKIATSPAALSQIVIGAVL